MPDPWLLVPPGTVTEGESITLEEKEAGHASGALRLRSGDTVVLADGRGLTARAVLRIVERSRAVAEVQSVRIQPQPSGDGVTLALVVLHGQAMDWAVRRSVEVGVRTLVPVVAERSQLPRTVVSRRLGHWRRVARQAIKQCRRPWAMEVSDPRPLADLVANSGCAGGLVADRGGQPVEDLPRPLPELLLVGPEGGFSDSEERALTGVGWTRVRLGPHVLRAETAAVVGAAMLVLQDD
jgi:16S rRNA (uracil1498-N3)-methyltransferase